MRISLAISLLPISLLAFAQAPAPAKSPNPPAFSRQEVMVPMRDGIHLQTAIFTPPNAHAPLPILFERTPYGVPESDDFTRTPSWKQLLADGYIVVFQNLRGRFKSEGTFRLSTAVDLNDPRATSETTDAYDSIDWLVKHVANNNGKVGMMGVSYDGLAAAMTLLHAHPALKAISEQASPADQWMNDDMHRYGAFRLSYGFEYAVMEQADKNANTHFDFDTYDTYQWYLSLGALANADAHYLHGSIPYWDDMMAHPNYDAYWRKEAWVDQVRSATVPNLNVAGWWDQEDPWGPWKIYRNSEQSDPDHVNYIVAGPWNHGGWRGDSGDSLGEIPFGGHKTAVEFRENIEAPWFRYWLHGEGTKFPWTAQTFQTGSNTWHTYAAWPPQAAKTTSLYLAAHSALSFTAPASSDCSVHYVSDPADPVPYRRRPISPTYPGGDWRAWEVADQRFADHRPDVATFISQPLDHDLTVTGALSADLFAATTGSDSDWVVKLIDVYPQNAQNNAWTADAGPLPGEYAHSLNGYELIIAAEVRRGRFNQSYEQPATLIPNQITEYKIPLRDHDHVFLKGHRIMVQVESSWFPLIDRNPQTFVPSIYAAKAEDYVKAEQTISCARATASHIELPVMPQ